MCKISYKIWFFLIFFHLVIFCQTPTVLFAQTSLIAVIQKSFSSFVRVESEAGGAFRSPGAHAAIDKKTGRLIVLRNVKAGFYKRQGAGVIIDQNGVIVTNAHIVSQASRVKVKLYDDTTVLAKVVFVNTDKDLAFIQIDPPYALRPIQFADSEKIRLHDEVVTVGNSTLLNQTISGGEIIGIGTSATEKKKGDEDIDLLQVNVNLYKGDSGGPLLDRKGRLIGLMVAGQLKKDRSSFAIPSNEIQKQFLKYLEERKTE